MIGYVLVGRMSVGEINETITMLMAVHAFVTLLITLLRLQPLVRAGHKFGIWAEQEGASGFAKYPLGGLQAINQIFSVDLIKAVKLILSSNHVTIVFLHCRFNCFDEKRE